jgi:hypothetical protein
MDLDPTTLAAEPMKLVCFNAPESICRAIDVAAAKLDPSAPNRSAYLRGAVISALKQDARR